MRRADVTALLHPVDVHRPQRRHHSVHLLVLALQLLRKHAERLGHVLRPSSPLLERRHVEGGRRQEANVCLVGVPIGGEQRRRLSRERGLEIR